MRSAGQCGESRKQLSEQISVLPVITTLMLKLALSSEQKVMIINLLLLVSSTWSRAAPQTSRERVSQMERLRRVGDEVTDDQSKGRLHKEVRT